jgi:hypothetical protein
MPNPIYPNLSVKPDSPLHNVEIEDPSMRSEMEGGYVVSRARHTRTPRNTWTIGYTSLRQADMQLLEDFYRLVRGGSVVFDWTDPETQMTGSVAKTYQVRFKGTLKKQYKGAGALKMWDVTFNLEQA